MDEIRLARPVTDPVAARWIAMLYRRRAAALAALPEMTLQWVKDERRRRTMSPRITRYGQLCAYLGVALPPLAGAPSPATWRAQAQSLILSQLHLRHPHTPRTEVARLCGLPYQWILAHLRNREVSLALYRTAVVCEAAGGSFTDLFPHAP